MLLAGVDVPNPTVRHLATLVARPLSDRLQSAVRFRSEVVGLSQDEKRAIMDALDRAAPDLADLRLRLLADPEWRAVTAVRR